MQKEPKKTRINIRLTDEQKRLLEERAGKYYMPVSEFMLEASLNAVVQPIPCTNFNQFARLDALMFDLKQIGSWGKDRADIAQITPLMEATQALLSQVMHDLTHIKDTRERIPLPPQVNGKECGH